MNAPPLPQEIPPRVDDTRRNYVGWITVGVLCFLTALVTAMSAGVVSKSASNPHTSDIALLRKEMSPTPTSVPSDADYSKAVARLKVESKTDATASMLYAELLTVKKTAVPASAIKKLSTSKSAATQAFFAIYSSTKLSKVDADLLISKLPPEPFVYQAAKIQALQKAGEKKEADKLIGGGTGGEASVAFSIVWGFLGAGVAIWIQLWRRYKDGTLGALGIPMDRISAHDADRLAVRAAQIFALFLVLSLIGSIVFELQHLLNEMELFAISGIATLALMTAFQNLPVDGKLIYFSSLGFTTKDLPKHIGLGVMGFIAELPVSILLSLVCAVVFKGLPESTHPATTALQNSHALRTVIPTLIAGSIIAPLWEELVFRGMLFPGLKRLLGGVLPAAILSSFMFASVHPQGVTLWFPLAFIGGVSCFLSYQSRSLVPGIVMHCLHNTAMFALALLG